jgi:hypothetical protein
MADVHAVEGTESDSGSAGHDTAQIIKMHHDKITPINAPIRWHKLRQAAARHSPRCRRAIESDSERKQTD